jgi:hypothetical protein
MVGYEMERSMGRPPIGKKAMTDAERMRRYREKRDKNKPVTKPGAVSDALTGTPAEIAGNILRALQLQRTRDVTEALTRRIAAIKPDCRACHGTGFFTIVIDSACGDPRLRHTHPIACDCSPECQNDPMKHWYQGVEARQKPKPAARGKRPRMAGG